MRGLLFFMAGLNIALAIVSPPAWAVAHLTVALVALLFGRP